MGLFDFFKKKDNTPAPQSEPAAEVGSLLSVTLLFNKQPVINADAIAAAMPAGITFTHAPATSEGAVFVFPEITTHIGGAAVPVNYLLSATTNQGKPVQLPATAYQQNWHWRPGNEVAKKCRYQLVLAEMMGRSLPATQRAELLGTMLVATINALKPQAIYSPGADKIISPDAFLTGWQAEHKELLTAACNVRLFKMEGSNGKLLMDTLGLHTFGLPDLQIVFSNIPEGRVAGFLWSYAYYLLEKGDVIYDGNTVDGFTPGSKWKCQHVSAQVAPDREVLEILTEEQNI